MFSVKEKYIDKVNYMVTIAVDNKQAVFTDIFITDSWATSDIVNEDKT